MIRIILPVFMIAIAGCQAARMPMPDDLHSAPSWTVEGRQGLKIRERLRFGPFEARDVDRSWTRSRDRVGEPIERIDRIQTYSFVLYDAGERVWLAKCSTGLDRGTVRTPIVDIDVRNRSGLDCAFTDAQGSDTWLLTLDESRERPLEGRLHKDSESYDVRGTNALQASLPTSAPSGYYVMDGPRTLAAVEVVNRGSVTVHPTVHPDMKSLFAAASAALLLLEDLRESVQA